MGQTRCGGDSHESAQRVYVAGVCGVAGRGRRLAGAGFAGITGRPRAGAAEWMCQQLEADRPGHPQLWPGVQGISAGDDLHDRPYSPHKQYDVWAEAAQTGPGYYGTGFLLRVVSYMGPSSYNVYNPLNYRGGVGKNAGVQSNPGIVTRDIPEFCCPARRSGLRPQDKALMQAAWWPGGGTDYGGCVGRHVAYDTSGLSHNVLDAGTPTRPCLRLASSFATIHIHFRTTAPARDWASSARST